MCTKFLILLALTCPETKIINKTKESLTSNDIRCYNVAKLNCVKHYPNSPCLKKFIKTGYQTYQAICGKKQ